MDVFYAHRAARQLEDLPRSVQRRIVAKMRFYATQRDPLKFARHLVDYREGEFRFRIGEYRVTFDVIKGSIYVLKIGKRDAVYD